MGVNLEELSVLVSSSDLSSVSGVVTLGVVVVSWVVTLGLKVSLAGREMEL